MGVQSSSASASATQPGVYAPGVNQAFSGLPGAPEIVWSHCVGIPALVQGNNSVGHFFCPFSPFW